MSTRIRFGEPVTLPLPFEKLPTSDRFDCLSDRNQSSPDKSFQVYISQDVLIKVWQHVREIPELECGGILVGHPFCCIDDPTLIFVVVVEAIRQESPNRSIGHFTVGPVEIAQAREVMETSYAGLVVVGWYHSHPGHGIFLSQQDLQVVHSIYNADWHLALVLDSIRDKAAFFYGPNGAKIPEELVFNPTITVPTPTMPAIVRAIAFYNQWLEAKNNGQLQEATEIKQLLQGVIQDEPELAHWRERGIYQTDDCKLDVPTDSNTLVLSTSEPMMTQSDAREDYQQIAQRFFEEANRLFDQGNYDTAYNLFRTLVDKYPDFKSEEVQKFIEMISTSNRDLKPRPAI